MPDEKDLLFSPYTLGDLQLPNRVIMAPLTRSRAKQPGDVPWELNAPYYAQLASAGLIIAEATQITPQGKVYDFFTNNCATYLLAFAKEMNFEVDAKIKAYVAGRLLQSASTDIVNRVRDSVNFKSLFNNDRSLRAVASDKQVIELVVETNAAGFAA